jgi:hypothetical protein
MTFAYRKHKNSLNGDWHFHLDCPLWPEADYIQTSSPRIIEENGHLCRKCVKLESPNRQEQIDLHYD